MKMCLLFVLLLMGCISTRTSAEIATGTAIIRAHPFPLKIFGTGNYGKAYLVLTLIDGSGQYMTVVVAHDDGLKRGHLYIP